MKERIKIVIQGKLPSLNEVVGANRSNKYAGASLKKATEKRIMIAIKKQCRSKFTKVRIDIEWYEQNRKRDFDNVSSAKKFILDALVKCEVIPNDGWKNIAPVFIDCFYYDKENPRVEVYLTDMME